MVWFEPTTTDKSTKPWMSNKTGILPSFASPNKAEFIEIVSYILNSKISSFMVQDILTEKQLKDVILICHEAFPTFRGLMITLGKHGFMMVVPSSYTENQNLLKTNETFENGTKGIYFSSFPQEKLVSVSGAGDCLAAGFIKGLLHGSSVSESAATGFAYADLSIQCAQAVPAQRLSNSSIKQFQAKGIEIC